VSILSDNGVSIETIADLVRHKTTIVTQKVYRHQLKPVIITGATTMNKHLHHEEVRLTYGSRLTPGVRRVFEKIRYTCYFRISLGRHDPAGGPLTDQARTARTAAAAQCRRRLMATLVVYCPPSKNHDKSDIEAP
jgi:hypothetical protein